MATEIRCAWNAVKERAAHDDSPCVGWVWARGRVLTAEIRPLTAAPNRSKPGSAVSCGRIRRSQNPDSTYE